MNLYPIAECQKKADRVLASGGHIYQQFLCGNCEAKQTMDTPDVFYEAGICEECGHTSDLKAMGCNFAVILGPLPPG